MPQTRALQITFVDGKYGHSSLYSPDVTRSLSEALRDRVVRMETFQIYSNFGRMRVGINNRYAPVENDILAFNGVVMPGAYTGEPSPETLAAIDHLTATPVMELHRESGHLRAYYPARYSIAEPLTGRVYEVFKSDCWSLCREYLIDHYGATGLPIGNKEEATKLSELFGRNFFMESYLAAGFNQVLIPKPGDMMVIGDDVQHTGIYLRNDMLLHHMPGRLSAIEPYDGWFEANTVAILRHGSAEA